MPKYIKADTIKFLIKYNADKITQKVGSDVILKLIDEMPGIEIVRCRECKYYSMYNKGHCNKPNAGMLFAKKIDFCSYGERRENE